MRPPVESTPGLFMYIRENSSNALHLCDKASARAAPAVNCICRQKKQKVPTILALGICGTIEAMLLVAVRSLEYGARFCALTFATRSQIFASYIYRRQKTYFFNFKTQLLLLHIILIFLSNLFNTSVRLTSLPVATTYKHSPCCGALIKQVLRPGEMRKLHLSS